MADLDDVQYLQPGFDPNSLTVPRLRNVLVTHDITYPSNAKKPQLVQLFNDEVLPQAKKLLAARRRIKPSSRGIVDVPSSQASTVDEEEEVIPEPPPSKKPGRRRTRAPEDDVDATLVAEPKTSRRTTSKHARSSDAEPESRPAPRRTRHSTTPAVKTEESEPEPWSRPADDSPFTSENPFQSHSSPPAEPRPRDGRRKTLDPAAAKEKRKSTSSRRRTDGPKVLQHDNHIKPPTSSTFNVPILGRKKEEALDGDMELVSAGEEFTPEEALEVAVAREKAGTVTVVPKRKKKNGSAGLTVGGLTISIMMLALGVAWRQEKIEVGYCGVGREPQSDLGGVTIPDWIQPICEPCPQHGICYPNLETKCEKDFVLEHHPLSLGGLWPLPPTCKPDSEKARRVATVTQRAIEELRERNAKYECSEPLEGQTKPPASPVISEDELKEVLSTKKSKRMTQEEFEALWDGALGEVIGRDEIVSSNEGGHQVLRSTSLARQSLICALRRSIRATLVRYLWVIVGSLLTLISVPAASAYISYNKATEVKAKDLAGMALDRLATQASLHASDPDAYPEPYISMSHLRDDVLRNEFSASRRTKLWEKVQNKVEQNSNIRPMVREGKHGDVSRVWEWIGAVRAIEDGGSARPTSGSRRKSARFGEIPSSPHAEYSTLPPASVKKEEMTETRKWDEGRPIY